MKTDFNKPKSIWKKNIISPSHINYPSEDKKYSEKLIRNCGFDPFFFREMQNYVYVYQKNPMKKVNSVNTILAIPINEDDYKIKQTKKNYVAEDKESYEQEEFNKILDSCVNTNHNNNTVVNNENSKLNYLVKNINNDVSNNNSVIKKYKSKLNSKFVKIYEANSLNIPDKVKYKLFHKCCYPGCNRTFSSSGWLRAHFKEHLDQIHKSTFSLLFDRFIYSDKVQLMNKCNNNFLGLIRKKGK